MPSKTALICGVSGQDGAYLARLLLQKGYAVHGSSRDAQVCAFANLHSLGIRERVTLHSMSLTDFRSIQSVLQSVNPDEVYNLGGQTSVGLSFEQPVETFESIAVGTLNFLEAIRTHRTDIRFYNAGSSECFGDTGPQPATEESAFRPLSPYGVAKSASVWQVANCRAAYGMYACSGLLFNHESPLRPRRFVTRKIVAGASAIAAGQADGLELGALDIMRDWGWAPDYVEAMWRMLQQESPDDFVIATGATYSLEDFVDAAFAYFGLDWKQYVRTQPKLRRPSDLRMSCGNPQKAKERLGWQARLKMPDVVAEMCGAEARREDSSLSR